MKWSAVGGAVGRMARLWRRRDLLRSALEEEGLPTEEARWTLTAASTPTRQRQRQRLLLHLYRRAERQLLDTFAI